MHCATQCTVQLNALYMQCYFPRIIRILVYTSKQVGAKRDRVERGGLYLEAKVLVSDHIAYDVPLGI